MPQLRADGRRAHALGFVEHAEEDLEVRAIGRDQEPPEGAAEEPFDLRKRRVDLPVIASVVVPDVDAAPLLVLDPREHTGGQTAVLVGAE